MPRTRCARLKYRYRDSFSFRGIQKYDDSRTHTGARLCSNALARLWLRIWIITWSGARAHTHTYIHTHMYVFTHIEICTGVFSFVYYSLYMKRETVSRSFGSDRATKRIDTESRYRISFHFGIPVINLDRHDYRTSIWIFHLLRWAHDSRRALRVNSHANSRTLSWLQMPTHSRRLIIIDCYSRFELLVSINRNRVLIVKKVVSFFCSFAPTNKIKSPSPSVPLYVCACVCVYVLREEKQLDFFVTNARRDTSDVKRNTLRCFR